ncbi:hypothetical protein HaLaN_28841 [Haematococcus lacustris]|uniref:Uncharacterized protein n=1 Tax=Haematococcus lacustris TaxID=44745 RepID=A0A6A0ACP7_HAELA|nr:hypothetical protein HaLaN_28841 [Haematococcus lacustris]
MNPTASAAKYAILRHLSRSSTPHFKDVSSNATAVKGRTAHSVTAGSIRRLRLPHFGLLLDAIAASAEYWLDGPQAFVPVWLNALQAPKCTRWDVASR